VCYNEREQAQCKDLERSSRLLSQNTTSRQKFVTVARDYALVILSVAATTFVRELLNPLFGSRLAFLVFFPALVFSAWVGGWGGGLLALVLSALVATFFFVAPHHSFLVHSQNDQITLLVFSIVGMSVSAISSSQRRARQQAQEAAEESQQNAWALRQSEARYRRLLETANEGIATIDTEDQIVYANPRLSEMLGYDDGELQGRSVYDLAFPEEAAQTKARRDQRRQGIQEQYELRMRRKDGGEVWVLANVTVIRENDEYTGTFSLFTDITERRLAEEKLRVRAEREAIVNRIGQAIRTSLDTEVIQATVAELLGEALHLDRCFYVTYNLAGNTLSAGRDWHRPNLVSVSGHYEAAEYAWIVEEMFAEGTAVIKDVREGPLSPEAAAIQESFGQRATLAVPFFHEGALVAALFAAMTEPRLWVAEEIALVEEVATLTRTALETARVSQIEHTIAQQLQAALQPTIPNAVPGLSLADYYRPALEEAGVGGDFSDVFASDKGSTFLVVGDLAGKGLAAASQVAAVRNMLRFALYNGRTLAGPVTTLSHTLAVYELLTGFATLFVGRYDAQTRRLSYVNCGQDAGLILRAATGQVETLPPTGPVLGAFDGAVYSEEVITLETGDVLALYTDGLTEAGPSRMALLTGDGVAALLGERQEQESASGIVSRLMASVDAYAQNGIRDDQCLLVAVAD
jgi:PAS domain S-box-containing protein